MDFWNQYAPEKDGVVIATNVSRLKCALYADNKNDVLMSYVWYIDRAMERTFRFPQRVVNIIEKCFAKDKDKYSWEKEVRLMHILKDTLTEPAPPGILLPVELGILIDRVYVSPYGGDCQVKAIKSYLAENGFPTLTVVKL